MKSTVFNRLKAAGNIAWLTGLALIALIGLASFAVPRKVQLQETKDTYGIVPFTSEVVTGDLDLGVSAANAVSTEFGKIETLGGRGVDVMPEDSVAGKVASLGITLPLKSIDVNRLGTELQATYLVTGTVVTYRIDNVQGGKTAQVIEQVVVWDVSSGIKINGAAVQGASGVRPDTTATSALLKEALKSAAYNAIRDIKSRILPNGTVLNTDGERSFVNKGDRAGFKEGQKVIIRRKGEQVAEGTVTQVEPSSCFVNVTRSIRGVQPGDKVQVVFEPPVPAPVFQANGTPRLAKSGGNSSNLGGLFQILLVIGLAALLLGGGRSGNQSLVNNVSAEAEILAANDTPAVRVGFAPDAFLRGNFESSPVQWQVWRNDVTIQPVISVLDGSRRSAIDDANHDDYLNGYTPRDQTNGDPSSLTCPGFTSASPPPFPVTTPLITLVPGTPYIYSAQLVYKINALSLPNGTTAGYCYYVTPTEPSGQATPLSRSKLQAPDDGNTVAVATSFKFTSVRGSSLGIPLLYVAQVSSTPLFSAGATVTFDSAAFTVTDTATVGGQTLSTPPIPFMASFPGIKTLYWRIGVRNISDNPGPVVDPNSGQRYIFSTARVIKTA